ncbi:MAG TPA: hypothetical protein VFL88_02570 [Gemmatimonadales bacterium]|jgi:hypothetical protein|nr:hypothetical protein [Gemmatimonadales bacterium]
MNDSHSAGREGAIAGVIGAAAVAIWYFIVDMLRGMPLHTPNAIAQLLFGNGSSDAGEFGTIAVVTVVHFAVFIVVGICLAALFHLAIRDIAWRMGVLFALVITFGFIAGLAYMLGPLTGETFPHWTVLGGALVGALAMGGFLWYTHPELAQSFRDVPLGDETESAPHPGHQ